ncbi:hypothetical protein N9114_04350 [Akkermansiaceae bacterium]|nr:hypothetical protein [Akkermansiaceae bacterium]MDB4501809.1 hypothetical protein [bacterium]MDA7893112.1 hypothetical protein [Akkermansiaceae bacterium]MDB4502534.1 hypothetical protein [Akkermansiaceae bacterium]MDB4523996.1 hypothetical protein [Akkermansiaceae bacterium]
MRLSLSGIGWRGPWNIEALRTSGLVALHFQKPNSYHLMKAPDDFIASLTHDKNLS